MEAQLTTNPDINLESYTLQPVRQTVEPNNRLVQTPGLYKPQDDIPAVSAFPPKPFIEANTSEISFHSLKKDCVIPVFSKDNERTIAHQELLR